MKQLYFLRHGESEFNRAKVWTGSSDTPLTPQGYAQAEQAGRDAKAADLKFDLVITSPLERTRETAKHFATAAGIPTDRIIFDNSIVERGFGKLEGRKDLVEATKYHLDEAAIDPYENVESLADLQRRAEATLAGLHNAPQDTILIVGHGAFGRALRRAINKESLDQRGQSIHNAELVKLI